MRIKIKFKGSKTEFTNNSLPLVKGWFEDNLLGRKNESHDKRSNYCISPLLGGVRKGKTESFPDGGYMYFSTNSEELMNTVVLSLFGATGSAIGDLFYESFEMVKDPHIHSDYDIIRTLSPLLLRSSHKAIRFDDERFIPLLRERAVDLLIENGIRKEKAETLQMELFHPENAKVVDVQYNGTHNFSNKVMLIVRGDWKAREALYLLGLGCCRGCGFGYVTVNNSER